MFNILDIVHNEYSIRSAFLGALNFELISKLKGNMKTIVRYKKLVMVILSGLCACVNIAGIT